MAAHRYWRARAYNGTYEPNNMACATLALRAVSGGTDLALGNAGIANFSYNGFVPANAFDGNINTFWTNVTGSALTTGYIGADFGGTPQDIIEMSYTVRNDSFREDPTALYLEWSDDNINWTILLDTGPLAPWSAGLTRTFTFVPPSIQAAEFPVIGVIEPPVSAQVQVAQLVVIGILSNPIFVQTPQSFGLPCWSPCNNVIYMRDF